MRQCLIALGIAAAISVRGAAQEARVFDGAVPANWIAPVGAPGDRFVVFHARRSFTLTALPPRFLVHVSADNRYRLYVNGVQVSSGPQRSDVAHWRYETVDIAPRLRVGRNVIAALVWNWGAAHDAQTHYANVKEHRNRRLAHSDLQTLLSANGAELPPVTRGELQRTIDGIAACLNELDSQSGKGRTDFTEVIQAGDGDALLRILRYGLDAQDERIHRKRDAAGLPPLSPAV